MRINIIKIINFHLILNYINCQRLSQFSQKTLSQWNCSKLNGLAELLDNLHGEKRHKMIMIMNGIQL